MALYISDCESLCLSDETVKTVGPFYSIQFNSALFSDTPMHNTEVQSLAEAEKKKIAKKRIAVFMHGKAHRVTTSSVS